MRKRLPGKVSNTWPTFSFRRPHQTGDSRLLSCITTGRRQARAVSLQTGNIRSRIGSVHIVGFFGCWVVNDQNNLLARLFAFSKHDKQIAGAFWPRLKFAAHPIRSAHQHPAISCASGPRLPSGQAVRCGHRACSWRYPDRGRQRSGCRGDGGWRREWHRFRPAPAFH